MNLKDSLVRSEVKRVRDVSIEMNKCNKKRCQVCNYVDDGKEFFEGEVKYYINRGFHGFGSHLVWGANKLGC